MLPPRTLLRVLPGRFGAIKHLHKRFSSTPAPNLVKMTTSAFKYLAIAGTVGAPCLWWLSNFQKKPTEKHENLPRLDSPVTDQLVLPAGLSHEEVTSVLRKHAYSVNATTVPGVIRYDGAQLAANSPCEDRFIHGSFPCPWNEENDESGRWMAWGIFDGHLGWQNADFLTKQLLPFVRRYLSQIPPSERSSIEAIHRAIRGAFTDLDKQLLSTVFKTLNPNASSPQPTPETETCASNTTTANTSKTEASPTIPLQDKVKALTLAVTGSCALLTLYDPQTSALHVACTGDSRAILGQQDPYTREWDVAPLSIDQDISHNQSEIDRLNTQHPNEPNIVKNGRVFGMMVSRAFGDAQWKWSLETQKKLAKTYHGVQPFQKQEEYLSPPYLIAEPVVTSTKLDKGKNAILVMASDGLWYLTKNNRQVIDAVSAWVDGQSGLDKQEDNAKERKQYKPGFDFGKFVGKDSKEKKHGVEYLMDEKRMTVRDGNAAVHLIRNSLGGDHDELLAGRVAYEAPFARKVRDDVTVQVVFFER
ncbi:phosphatase 2C-like domain-containing protein [Cladorrhinum sp. PSN259]|nr:phosphatase 2C-like domain-containing protein [Cladorrhinum sp. PSN259]